MILQEKLRDLLLNLPGARTTHGGKEITSRCEVCGDSKNPRHAHLVINLGYNDTPLYYNCVRCHENRGLLTPNKLIEWGLYSTDFQLPMEMTKYNKQCLNIRKNSQFKDHIVYNIGNHYINDNKVSRIKLDYINKRLGLKLSYNDLLEKKIILNLKDLLSSNNINRITRKEGIVDQLNDFFIGFISEDNAFVNCRCLIKDENEMKKMIYPSICRRYTQYSLFNKFDTSRNNYVIPSDINILYRNNIKVNIAEGAFDILSVYYNLRDQESKNCIYSAISGNNYVNLCRYFILYLAIPNIEFHIYLDNDVKDYYINQVIYLCKDLNIDLYLHRNLYPNEKDFGVSKDRIKEQIVKV